MDLRWTSDFKHRVRARLERWFPEVGIEPPADLVDGIATRQRQSAPSSTELLRRIVIRYVEQMAEEELLALQIPRRGPSSRRSFRWVGEPTGGPVAHGT